MKTYAKHSADQGFTLIELLIVVAIIAILAAIAVPNFMEAQVRAKVARVKADMASLAVALESYHVDYTTYPLHYFTPWFVWMDTGKMVVPVFPSCSAGIALSTPVAYVSSGMMPDAFAGSSIVYARGTEAADVPNYLNIATGVTDSWSRSHLGAFCFFGDESIDFALALPRDCWMVVSVGPDRASQTDILLFPYAPCHPPGSHIYDATNGTRSTGDIFRTSTGRCPKGYWTGREPWDGDIWE